MILEHRQAVVVGSGLAGLTSALSLAPLDTLMVTKTAIPVGGSTPWAQGGVAFPRDAEDAPVHIQDTLVSGAGHTDPQAAKFLVDQAPAARDWLEAQGVAFDRNETGAYHWGREGAHSSRRILHVGADGTGAGLALALANRLPSAPHITVRPEAMAIRLVPGGLLLFEAQRGLVLVLSPRILLAGGGLGQLFAATTAPVEATGDTIALALEAGATLKDLEMVQYHPTALAVQKTGAPNLSLLTEALRGEGALLVTADTAEGVGLHPLDTGHPLGSLGPRDVLSRAIFHRQAAGFPVWLDARSVENSARRFPTVTRLCAEVGLDPSRDLLPVVPAVHYTMGGVATDLEGRTSLPGLWAAGETSRTGVHGANRLASNSLLECVVFGRAAATSARVSTEAPRLDPVTGEALARGWGAWKLPPATFAQALRPRIQGLMSRAAGPVRDGAGLKLGLEALTSYQDQWDKAASGGRPLSDLTFQEVRAILETRSLLTLGPAVLGAALARTASLGAHHRSDSI
ncbi:MAG TPA: FAD-binding protein [Spirochaetia bacterium]|nr:FAD-binding protein [Spirochaetia bacterium]